MGAGVATDTAVVFVCVAVDAGIAGGTVGGALGAAVSVAADQAFFWLWVSLTGRSTVAAVLAV